MYDRTALDVEVVRNLYTSFGHANAWLAFNPEVAVPPSRRDHFVGTRRDIIVFTTNRDGDWELYTIRPDGTDLKRLTNLTLRETTLTRRGRPMGTGSPSRVRAADSKTKWRAAAEGKLPPISSSCGRMVAMCAA